MKVLLAAVLLVGTASLVHADQVGPAWMTLSQVTHDLQSMGYTNIGKIEADDGLWKAHTMKGGLFYKVELDPYSGHVIRLKQKHDDEDYYEHEDYYGQEDHDHD